MVIFPNCKINIGLHVYSKRSDGYHTIETLFVPVRKLNDILEISESKEMEFHCTGIDSDKLIKDNICTKAYQLLKEDYTLPPVKMHLHKCIPVGAGLGGGSSDAASTLLLLNKLFQLSIDNKILADYASELGSDCAFFIENHSAIGKQKGDLLTSYEISQLKDKYLYIVKPPFSISTADAYRNIQLRSSRKSLKSYLSLPIQMWGKNIQNDFEKQIFEQYPVLEQIKKQFYTHKSMYASLSGSGSAMFAIFDHRPMAMNTFPLDYFQWIGKME